MLERVNTRPYKYLRLYRTAYLRTHWGHLLMHLSPRKHSMGTEGPSRAVLSKLGPHVTALRFWPWHPVKRQQAMLWAGQGSQEVWDFIYYYENKLRGWDLLPQSTSVKIPLLWWRKSSSLTKDLPSVTRKVEAAGTDILSNSNEWKSLPLKGDVVNHVSFVVVVYSAVLCIFLSTVFYSPKESRKQVVHWFMSCNMLAVNNILIS